MGLINHVVNRSACYSTGHKDNTACIYSNGITSYTALCFVMGYFCLQEDERGEHLLKEMN